MHVTPLVASTALAAGVPISTISFGTLDGVIAFEGQQVPVPVDDESLKTLADMTGGQFFKATSLEELTSVYSSLQDSIGYQIIRGDASDGWIRLGAALLAAAAVAGVLINRRLPH